MKRLEVILNGTTKGDKEGDFTFGSARSCLVIDYVVVTENCDNMVKRFRIMERDSDYMPLVVELKKEGEEERRAKGTIGWKKKEKGYAGIRRHWSCIRRE